MPIGLVSSLRSTTSLYRYSKHCNMDLGFGSSNQALGVATANALLQSTHIQEKAIEDELDHYNNLLDDDAALEILRKQRLASMQKEHALKKKWKDLGHGTYVELGGGGQDGRDVARGFFQASKESERMVIHFYRPTTRYCDAFHAHLAKLAPKHLETRFVKVNVQDCDHQGGGASFLVERLGIVVMPTLLIVKDRKAYHQIRGFDEIGGTEDFSTNTLAYVLGAHGAIDLTDDEETPPDFSPSSKGVNSINIRKGSSKYGYAGDDI